MDNKDSKARDASNRVTRGIQKDRGAPGGSDREDGSRVFVTSDIIPQTVELEPAAYHDADAAQRERHLNHGTPLGGRYMQGALDNVDRSDFPEAAALASSFMGNEPFRTAQGSEGVSTQSRQPYPPRHAPHWARSTVPGREPRGN